MEVSDLVAYSYERGKNILENREANILKENGQFQTPPSIARYLARQWGKFKMARSCSTLWQTNMLDEEFQVIQEAGIAWQTQQT